MTKIRYTAVPRTLCFITREDQVLLLLGAPTKRLWANQLNGVGGHVELGEDVQTAAIREMREETGLGVANVRLRGVLNIPPGPEQGTPDANTGVLLFVFTAEEAGGVLTESHEGTLMWVSQQELIRGEVPNLVYDLRELLPRALAAEEPFFA